MKKIYLEITVLISGAVVMIFELVGSRIFAPYLGTSLIIWTSLIGVILGSLSIGYWWGGRMADRNPNNRKLSRLLVIGALLIAYTWFFQSLVLYLFQKYNVDLRLAGVLAGIVLFSPASIVLGMISPYAIRLKLDNLKDSGETIGSMYAISTVGSIIGTFLAGFYLIPFLGTSNILFVIIIALVVAALIVRSVGGGKISLSEKVILALLFSIVSASFVQAAVAPRNLKLIDDVDTLYGRFFIYEGFDQKSNRPVRALVNDPSGMQSAIFIDNDNDLVFDYLKYYRLAPHFNPEIKTALMIGGGAYTYPRDFLKRNPDTKIEVVEIDEELLGLAKKYFNFQDDSRVVIHSQDGRIFLNNNKNKYDCVFLDAFTSRHAIPFQLTTQEAVQKIYDSLNDDGVILANVISTIEGDGGKFLRAEVATYKTVFPQVYIFPIQSPDDPAHIQNILLVAIKADAKPEFSSEDPELNEYLGHLYEKEVVSEVPILTDDFAPVDFYILSALEKK